MDRPRQNDHLGVNKIRKNIRKSPLHQPSLGQPHVYNIKRSDFRRVVQQLTGSPSRESLSRPPHNNSPKPQNTRLHMIRPSPLTQINSPAMAPPQHHHPHCLMRPPHPPQHQQQPMMGHGEQPGHEHRPYMPAHEPGPYMPGQEHRPDLPPQPNPYMPCHENQPYMPAHMPGHEHRPDMPPQPHPHPYMPCHENQPYMPAHMPCQEHQPYMPAPPQPQSYMLGHENRPYVPAHMPCQEHWTYMLAQPQPQPQTYMPGDKNRPYMPAQPQSQPQGYMPAQHQPQPQPEPYMIPGSQHQMNMQGPLQPSQYPPPPGLVPSPIPCNLPPPDFSGPAPVTPTLPSPRFDQMYTGLPSPRYNGFGQLNSPTSQFAPPSPNVYPNMFSPRSPYPLLSPGVQYPQQPTANFSFSQQLAQSGSFGSCYLQGFPSQVITRWSS